MTAEVQDRVRLIGGPFDGQTVPRPADRSLLIDGGPVPEGSVARYRMTRDRDVFRFKGFDRIVMRVETAS